VLGFAGKHGADGNGLDARFLDALGYLFGNLFVHLDDELVGYRVLDAFKGIAAHDAVVQVLEDFLAVLYGQLHDAVDGAAVVVVGHHVLRDVHEAPGEITCIRRLERRIGQTFAGAVRRDEELDYGKAFLEVRADRKLDDVSTRLGHQSAHTGQLPDLVLGTARAGVRHHVDVVESALVFLKGLHHHVGNVLIGLGPHFDDLVVALFLRYVSGQILLLDAFDLAVGFLDELVFFLRNDYVVHADGRAEERGVLEAHILDRVQHDYGYVRAFVLVNPLDEEAYVFFTH